MMVFRFLYYLINAVIQIKSQIRSALFCNLQVPLPFLFSGKLFVEDTEIFLQFEFASYIPVVVLNMFLCPLGFLLIDIRFRGWIRFGFYEVCSLCFSFFFFYFEQKCFIDAAEYFHQEAHSVSFSVMLAALDAYCLAPLIYHS